MVKKCLRWQRTLEPRQGFWAETGEKEVPLHKPEHGFKTEGCYVGDLQHKQLQRYHFQVNGMQVEMESTANDSLVVLSMNSYYVCPICGYAVNAKKQPQIMSVGYQLTVRRSIRWEQRFRP